MLPAPTWGCDVLKLDRHIFLADVLCQGACKSGVFCFNPFCSEGSLGGKDKGSGGVISAGGARKPRIEVFCAQALTQALFERANQTGTML